MAVQLMPNGAEPIGGHRPQNDSGHVKAAWSVLPYKNPREGRCAGRTSEGKLCRRWAWAGSELCYSHKREAEGDTES